MKQNRKQNRNQNRNCMAFMTKEVQYQREEKMERLHPGYLDMNLRLHVMLGAVLFARGVFHALSVMLGQELPGLALLTPISLFVGYYMYRYCIRWSHGLAKLLFAFRMMELVRCFWQFGPYVFYLNFIGLVWFVTMVAVLLLDAGFLGYLVFFRKAKQQVEYNRIVWSGQSILLGEVAAGYQNTFQGEQTDDENPACAAAPVHTEYTTDTGDVTEAEEVTHSEASADTKE